MQRASTESSVLSRRDSTPVFRVFARSQVTQVPPEPHDHKRPMEWLLESFHTRSLLLENALHLGTPTFAQPRPHHRQRSLPLFKGRSGPSPLLLAGSGERTPGNAPQTQTTGEGSQHVLINHVDLNVHVVPPRYEGGALALVETGAPCQVLKSGHGTSLGLATDIPEKNVLNQEVLHG